MVANTAMMENVASEHLESRDARENSPIMQFSTKLVHASIGKLASSRKIDPAIRRGVDTRKPSRIAIRNLFRPMAEAMGIRTFSSLSIIDRYSLFLSYCFPLGNLTCFLLSSSERWRTSGPFHRSSCRSHRHRSSRWGCLPCRTCLRFPSACT